MSVKNLFFFLLPFLFFLLKISFVSPRLQVDVWTLPEKKEKKGQAAGGSCCGQVCWVVWEANSKTIPQKTV